MQQTLRVGHKDYDFQIVSLETLGVTNHQRSYIHIDQALCPTELVSTILHEISHALSWVFTMHQQESVTEEKWCDVMGNGLTMVFRDNPWLLTFIKETLEK